MIALGGNYKNICKRVTYFDSMKVGRDLKLRRNESWGNPQYIFAKQQSNQDMVDPDRPGLIVSRDETVDEVHSDVFELHGKGKFSELEFAEVLYLIVSL